jgi:transcription initiation factor TFIIB
LAAALYIACRQLNAPRTLDDITTISNIKRKSIAKYDREIIIQLSLKLPTIDTTKCIARVANKVNLSEKTKHHAINFMNDVVKNGIAAGRSNGPCSNRPLYFLHKEEERVSRKRKLSLLAQLRQQK